MVSSPPACTSLVQICCGDGRVPGLKRRIRSAGTEEEPLWQTAWSSKSTAVFPATTRRKNPGAPSSIAFPSFKIAARALSVTDGIVPGTVPTHPVRCRYGREHGPPAIPNAPAGGIAQKWKEGTLTLAYLPTSQMELRGEVRYDKSDKSVFGMVSGAPKDSQSSVGVEALYKF